MSVDAAPRGRRTWYSVQAKGGPSLKQMEAAAMRLHAYRDENRSAHVELMGGGDHPWTIDLVTLVALVILVAGFAGALVAQVL
jgi:hypothetical protein